METDGTGKLRDYVDGLPGVACTLLLERMGELTALALPEAAASEAWWTDPSGWDAWPPSSACRSAGWRVESVHPDARVARLRRG